MTAHLTRTAKALVVALVTTFALAGCLKVDFELVLQPDDTVDGSITYAIAEGTGELMSSEDETYTDEELLSMLFGDLDASTYANGVLSDYAEEDWIGKTITFEGEELAGFALDESSDGLTIVHEGDEFVVSGPYDAGDELTDGTEGAEMTLSITFPGKVTETNGTLSEDEHTVTWDLLDAPDTLEARGGATEGSDFPWLIVIIVLVVIAIAGGAVGALLVIRRRGAGDAPAEATEIPPAPVAEGNLDTLFPPAEEPVVETAPEGDEAASEEAVAHEVEADEEPVVEEPAADEEPTEATDEPAADEDEVPAADTDGDDAEASADEAVEDDDKKD